MPWPLPAPETPPLPARTFSAAASHDDAALIPVDGTGPDDVWIVGAQPAANTAPIVLHGDGSTWTPVATRQVHDLWWVHAFADGPVYLVGAGATILRVDGDGVTRLRTPGFSGQSVFGVWGPRPDDVWAVGGFAGRSGFVWRIDGVTVRDEPIPLDVPRSADDEIGALLKVWGRGADDVWIVGGVGTTCTGTAARSPSCLRRRRTRCSRSPATTKRSSSSAAAHRGSSCAGASRASPRTRRPALLQGVVKDRDGTIWVAGSGAFAAGKPSGTDWQRVDLGFASSPASIHALWEDGAGDLYAVGGDVLSPALDKGVAVATRPTTPFAPEPRHRPSPPAPTTPSIPCPTTPSPAADASSSSTRPAATSRTRRCTRATCSTPRPPCGTRGPRTMPPPWASSSANASTPAPSPTSTPSAKRRCPTPATACSCIATKTPRARRSRAIASMRSWPSSGWIPRTPASKATTPSPSATTSARRSSPTASTTAPTSATAYADTTGWEPTNPVLVVDRPGVTLDDPNTWQQLNLALAETQHGIVLDENGQPYLGPHWREVTPFALRRDPDTGLYSAPGPFPRVDDPALNEQVVEIIRLAAELDPDDGVRIDISPGARGNNPLGENSGKGHRENPATDGPYAANLVKRGDFARVVAEMWADGPKSETPPGHWMKIAHDVSDAMAAAGTPLRPWGEGEPVDRLTWDTALGLVVSASTHDAAIAAWELKRESLGPRPICLVRWFASKGQRSDPSLPSYDPEGLPLIDGLIELISPESSAPGERHFALRHFVGELGVRGWPGEPGSRLDEHTPVQWMRAREWIPYQRRTFVTPAFPGFVSGHSTFSRAAAEALTAFTGSPFFPGGLGEFVARAGDYLVFEDGPTEDVHLQWATSYDAADQAGQSRRFGGIHICADDRAGRIVGSAVGLGAVARFRALWDGDD